MGSVELTRIHTLERVETFFMPEPSISEVIVTASKDSILQENKEISSKPKTLVVSFAQPNGPGGLVSGVGPFVNKSEEAMWIYAGEKNGHSNGIIEKGGAEEALRTTVKTSEGSIVNMYGIPLDQKTRDSAYYMISNGILWPFLHDMPERSNMLRFERDISLYEPAPKIIKYEAPQKKYDRFSKKYEIDMENFIAYDKVQEMFADAIQANADNDTFTLVNDYHLTGVARKLRDRGQMNLHLAMYAHTSFPELENFEQMDQRIQEYVIDGLLAYDFVGFQTVKSKENFILAAKKILHVPDDAIHEIDGITHIQWKGIDVKLKDVPISIDVESWKDRARQLEVLRRTREIRQQYAGEDLFHYLGRRDYTKGIPEFIEAIDLLFEEHPEYIGNKRFIISAPETRPNLTEYQREDIIDTYLIKVANRKWKRRWLEKYGKGNTMLEKYTDPGKKWSPIVYFPNGLRDTNLLAYYGATDYVVLPSKRDGHVLAVDEAFAVWRGQQSSGKLVIAGENIGAIQTYKNAVMTVNPNNRNAFAAQLYNACVMPKEKKDAMMQEGFNVIDNYNVYTWGEIIKEITMQKGFSKAA